MGDVTDRVQLTPVAIREGHAFADTVFGGKPAHHDLRSHSQRRVLHPPLAGVGLTESAGAQRCTARSRSSHRDFRPMKNVFAGRNERGSTSWSSMPISDRVVGVHMIGPEAPEILQAAAIAVKAGLTKADFDDTVALASRRWPKNWC